LLGVFPLGTQRIDENGFPELRSLRVIQVGCVEQPVEKAMIDATVQSVFLSVVRLLGFVTLLPLVRAHETARWAFLNILTEEPVQRVR
jgi:hypothetical protein